jgi:hypothetical protein
MNTSLAALSFRRTLWPAALVGGLALAWVVYSTRFGTATELAAWSRSESVSRHAIWVTGIWVGGPLLLASAASIGHRLTGADAAWCASRSASRWSVLLSSWAGAAAAATLWVLCIATTAEWGGSSTDSPALQRLAPAQLQLIGSGGSDLVTWYLDAPSDPAASTLRLPIGLVATGGPSARVRVRLARRSGAESTERELLIATTRPIEIGLPDGTGPLRLELERLEEGALVLVPADHAQWWRTMPTSSSASWVQSSLTLLVAAALLAWAISLGTWMRPAPATALLLSIALALWFTSGALGGWESALDQLANGDVPESPTLQGAAIAIAATCAGLFLGRARLNWGGR